MRRAPQEIRTYHVSFVTAGRRSLFQVDANAELLLHILQTQREKKRMEIHAFVIMRDHVHLVLTPAEDVSLEKAVQFIKGGFSFQLKSKPDIWERSFNETQILTLEKFAAFRYYVEQNPVRKGIALEAEQYPFSSAHRIGSVDPVPTHFVRNVQG